MNLRHAASADATVALECDPPDRTQVALECDPPDRTQVALECDPPARPSRAVAIFDWLFDEKACYYIEKQLIIVILYFII